MKKITTLIFIFLFASFVSLSAEDKYAVVDTQKVLQASKAFKSFQDQVEKYKKEIEKNFTADSDKLKATEQDLVNKRAEYSPKDFEKKKADFEKDVNTFRTKVQEKQQNFDKIGAEVLGNIEKEAQKAIKNVAKAGGYTIVYQAVALADYDESRDISSQVLGALDKALPTVAVKKP